MIKKKKEQERERETWDVSEESGMKQGLVWTPQAHATPMASFHAP